VSEEPEVLKLVAARLDSAGIPYMVSGSTAMSVTDLLAEVGSYGQEFDPATAARIIARLRSAAAPSD
jgi:hypothetical protein